MARMATSLACHQRVQLEMTPMKSAKSAVTAYMEGLTIYGRKHILILYSLVMCLSPRFLLSLKETLEQHQYMQVASSMYLFFYSAC
jgi:hypothetical protein